MSKNVGLIYGKPRVRKLSIQAGSVVNNISLSYQDKSYQKNSLIVTEVSPFQTVTIEANIPNASISSNRLYHNGDEPSEGNYYYNEVTNYQFDKWINEEGRTASTNTRYEFQMPVQDESLTGIGSIYYTEANKVYAVSVTAENTSTTDISSIKMDGSDSSVIYKWPEDNVVLLAIPKADSVDTTTYRYGPTGVNGSPIADANNTRWYMRTNHYAIGITDSNGVTYNSSNITAPTGANITFSFHGSSETVRTSITNAKSVAITASGITNNAESTYKTSGYTQKWYWDNSSETSNTTGYISTSSWYTSSASGFLSSTSESKEINPSNNVASLKTSQYGSSNIYTVNSYTGFNGATSSWIDESITSYTDIKQSMSVANEKYAGYTINRTYITSTQTINGVTQQGVKNYTYQTLTTYNLYAPYITKVNKSTSYHDETYFCYDYGTGAATPFKALSNRITTFTNTAVSQTQIYITCNKGSASRTHWAGNAWDIDQVEYYTHIDVQTAANTYYDTAVLYVPYDKRTIFSDMSTNVIWSISNLSYTESNSGYYDYTYMSVSRTFTFDAVLRFSGTAKFGGYKQNKTAYTGANVSTYTKDKIYASIYHITRMTRIPQIDYSVTGVGTSQRNIQYG